MDWTFLRKPPPQFLVAALFGLAISGVLAALVLRADEVRARAAFEQLAQQRISQATEHVHEALQDLVSLRAFVESAGRVSRTQFDSYCAPLLANDTAIQALEWIPAVPQSQRPAFELQARRDGFPRFAFTEHTAQGMRPEGVKAQYFPVYYVAPYRGNEAALGFDLASNPARRAALLRAAATGAMVATSRIVLVQAQNAGYGFLVFYPVYKPGELPGRAQPIGFVLGVFKVADVVRPSRGSNAANHGPVSLAVFDITHNAAGQAGAELYPKGRPVDLRALRDRDFDSEQALDVGGRTWKLIAWQAPPASAKVEAGVVFGAGLLATLLVLALMRQLMITRESQAARELALRSDATKSRFLANVSHEIRTPLNGVIGMLDLLLQSSLRPEQMRMAQVSRRSAVDLLGIINDLLDFSKIEAGRLDVVLEPVPLRELLDEEVEIFRNLADKSGCELSHHIDDAVPACILGDDLRLRQVLNNLLSNAIKFSSGQARTGRIELLAGVTESGWLELAVVDNGIGIESATQARLFKPFEQADPGTTKRYGGTGLGLTITRHLVELMGGEITLRSHAGTGSRFTIRLPMRECEGAAVQPASGPRAPRPGVRSTASGRPEASAGPLPRPEPTDTSAPRVLLAEDNETNQQVLRLQLASCGFEADIAGDGAQAVDLYRRGRHQLVLSDLHMPVLDGFGLARAIRTLEREQGWEPATILAVTAAALETELSQARQAGMDGHLVKPIRLEALREALQEWSRAHGAAGPRPAPAAQAGNPADGGAAETASGEESSVDLRVLRGLVGDQEDIVRALAGQFLEELRSTQAAMSAARDSSETKAIGELAHRLKSSARSVGAMRLGDLCERIEKACKSNQGPEALALLDEFERLGQEVQQDLLAALRGGASG